MAKNRVDKDTAKVAWNKTNGHCWYCGQHLYRQRSEDFAIRQPKRNWFAVDHMLPLSRGGTNHIDNLIACCWSCNGFKSNRTVSEFRLHLQLRTQGAPDFSVEQLAWLLSMNFVIPGADRYYFWGELERIEPAQSRESEALT